MKILLDTHTLLWAVSSPGELSTPARAAIGSDGNVVYAGIVSLWELRIKESSGKIKMPDDFYKTISDKGFEILTMTLAHITALGSLPFHHRDPFDRMLVAQAKTEQLLLITRDDDIKKYGVNFLQA